MRSSCLLLAVFAYHSVIAKVFHRCELVQELSKKRHRIPTRELSTWVCIARHESQYNTSAVGHLNADMSGDHGLFQISDQYWCSPPGVGLACGLNCDQLEDDNITDDVICARRIYRAHKRRTGDGFTAWAVYGPHCRGDTSSYVDGCEDWSLTPTTVSSSTTKKPSTTTSAPTTPWDVVTTEDVTQEELVSYSTTESSYSDEKYTISDSQDVSSSDPDLSEQEPVSKSSTRQSHSRFSQTRSPWDHRPTFTSAEKDPKTAWLSIHYDPRFLDETP